MRWTPLKLILSQLLLVSMAGFLWAQDSSSDATGKPADNTKVNQRDRNKAEPTADQQKENRSDRETARQIRRAIVKDKTLSTYAHNVKVIVQNGAVTLKGPVRSDDEKKAVEAKAAEVVGSPDKVTSQIEVAAKDSGKPSASQDKTN